MHEAKTRELLLFAYEFPPSAGGGVQRVAKLSRYLPEAGWRPTVVAADPTHGSPIDSTLLDDVAEVRVTRLRSRHVAGGLARAFAPFKNAQREDADGSSASDRDSDAASQDPSARSAPRAPLSSRISRWVAVPDDAVAWRRSAVREGLRLHGQRRFDAVLASGPPYSALLAGVEAAGRMGVPCVIDLRDAWRDNPALRWPTHWHAERSLALERRVMRDAEAVLAVSEPIAEEARSMGARDVTVLPNGFDPADLPAWRPDRARVPRIAFMGRFYEATDPTTFFRGLALASQTDRYAAEVHVDIIGPEVPWVTTLIAELELGTRVRRRGFLAHAEALELVSRADAGLVTLADRPGSKAVYTGKLFEYLGMGIPVLFVGPPDGVAAELLTEASAGVVVPSGDEEAAAKAIVQFARDKAKGLQLARPDRDVVARFDRREQASQVGRILDAVSARAEA